MRNTSMILVGLLALGGSCTRDADTIVRSLDLRHGPNTSSTAVVPG
jgi:hypothetical protein